MNSKNVLLSSIVAIIAFFSAQNTHSINLNILFWNFSVSLIILIYVIFFSGVVVGMLYFSRKKKVKIQKVSEDKNNSDHVDVDQKKSKKFFKR